MDFLSSLNTLVCHRAKYGPLKYCFEIPLQSITCLFLLPVRAAPQVKGKKKYIVKKGAVAALRFALCINGKGASNTYMEPKEKIPAKVSKYRKAFFSFI